MLYVILKASNPVDLERLVEHWMHDGWKPQGGVSLGHIRTETEPGRPDDYDYAQAMVKDDPNQYEKK